MKNEQAKITSFYLDPEDLEKWLHQNKAVYTGDFIEGCLLDNFVVMTKRGFAALYEHCKNEWTSNYLVTFQPGTAQNVWAAWYIYEEAAEETA